MVLRGVGQALALEERPVPEPGPGQVRLRVGACGVCRTDLHIVDGELEAPSLPLVPGHQIVGVVDAVGADAAGRGIGDRVGVPWLGFTCGECSFCRSGRENLCDKARFTGFQIDGGFADYAIADARFCLPIPAAYPDHEAAPLLCAGLIGYRALKLTGDAKRLGLYGFGAAAHILAQVARYEGREVFAFTRPGDRYGQEFALHMGASWAGDADSAPPSPLDAAIVLAPAGELVVAALRALGKGGVVVCAGIHMSDIPSFPYRLLGEERALRSVANLTRSDGAEFLAIAPKVPVRAEVQTYPLTSVNQALDDLRAGRVRGAAVVRHTIVA